ncbi:protein FAR1-related sequence 5-like [Rhizophagus clarus]|uniref:Protein FAR1-related sequence 5-like n=1 Tax=Rhizophagus clarus TaxID=94130 RepID=A0A8H3KNZ1_9GLOM|nr:protein FAR1-related sequence 5-like [Rhizophagus clarus]
MNSIINDLELEYDQEDSNKENTLALTENLEKQAEELAVEYRFESWEHVDQVLYAYAKIKGFVWRLQNTYYRADGDISKKVFECSHSGMPRMRKSNNPNKTRNTTSSRVGCTYYINILFAPLYRSLSESVLNRIKFYVNNSPGMEKDVINAIQRFKQNNHNEINDPDSDAFWLLEKLEIQQKDDPEMFIAKKIHQGRLFHIFWMDSNQQDLYQRYYDVIVTDNTSRTNRYQMALCFFVGVDNRNYTRIFAQALLSDETSSSYVWVLEQLLKANNGILPAVLLSDADTGLDAAIKNFLPNVKHVHCIFHICQNLDRHVQRSLGENYTEFLSKFYSVRNSLNETLFNIRWEQLIELFPCANDYLMGTLDKIKES